MDIPVARPRESYHVGNLAPRLLAAARSLLERGGAANLSLRALSKEVGVSATASYHHFSTRHELLSHLAAEGFTELRSALARVIAQAGRAPLLDSACLAYLEFARCNPALYQLMFGPDLAGEDAIPKLRTAREDAFTALKAIITVVLGPDAKDTDAQRAAVACWSYTHGLASLWLHGVLHTRSNPTSEQLVRRTLPAFAQLIEAARRD